MILFLHTGGDHKSVARSLQPNSNHSDDSLQSDGSGTVSSGFQDDETPESSHEFMVEGQRKDVNTIFLKLRILDNSAGDVRSIHFPSDIEVDTTLSVASEMVAELDFTYQGVTTIAEMIDSEILTLVPEWEYRKPLGENNDANIAASDNDVTKTKDELCPLPSDSDPPTSVLVLERLPSRRKYWSDSPKDLNRGSPARPNNFSSHLDDFAGVSSVFSEHHGESSSCEDNGENEAGAILDSQLCEDQNDNAEQPMDPQLRESQDGSLLQLPRRYFEGSYTFS